MVTNTERDQMRLLWHASILLLPLALLSAGCATGSSRPQMEADSKPVVSDAVILVKGMT